jgi:hypothetical protein
MKHLILAALLLAFTAAESSAAQSIAFDDLGSGGQTASSGTYDSTAAFSLDVNLTFSGYSSVGLTYYLEASSALAPYISITSITYFTFTDANSTISNPENFNQTTGSSSGFLSNLHDLGGTEPTGTTSTPAGTYTVAQISFAITGAPTGNYTLETTTINPKGSIVSDSSFNDNPIPVSTYTITIVPEPSTAVLAVIGCLGMGFLALRRARLRRS